MRTFYCAQCLSKCETDAPPVTDDEGPAPGKHVMVALCDDCAREVREWLNAPATCSVCNVELLPRGTRKQLLDAAYKRLGYEPGPLVLFCDECAPAYQRKMRAGKN